MQKQSKQKISVLQRKLWDLCRKLTFKEHGTDCYTCGQTKLTGINLQCGHLYAKASLGAFLKYDLRVLRPQCARCNVFLGGMGAVFYTRMFREKGKKYMEKLEQDKQVTVKAHDHYLRLIDEYTNQWQKSNPTGSK